MHPVNHEDKQKKAKCCKFAEWLKGTRQNSNECQCIRRECIGKACVNYRPYMQSVEMAVRRAQEGDISSTEKLIKEFKNYVFQMDKRYFIPGSDKEDLYQEGFAGLCSAIKTFQPGGELSFRDYVSLSVRNSVIRAIRTATQKKQMVLTNAKSIFDKSIMNMESRKESPEEVAIRLVTAQQLCKIIKTKLTETETEMIRLKVTGFTAEEIAKRLCTDKKVVDNTLYRARLKVKKLFANGVHSLAQSFRLRKKLKPITVGAN